MYQTVAPMFVDNKICQLATEGQLVGKTSRVVTGVIHFSTVLVVLTSEVSLVKKSRELKCVCRYHHDNCCEKNHKNVTGPLGALVFDVKPEVALQ